MQQHVDVAVVGGGPGGLSAAAALLRVAPHLRVRVYERSRLQARGAHLFLPVEGLAALRAIRPELGDAVYALRSEHTRMVCCGLDGVVKSAGVATPLGGVRASGARVFWHELQATLAAALPPGVLHTEASFNRYEDQGDGVVLSFHGGQPPVAAGLLVGADGGCSAVRSQCIKGDGPLRLTGQAVWRVVVPRPAWWDWPGEGSVIFTSGATSLRVIGKPAAPPGQPLLALLAVAPWPEAHLRELCSAAYVQDPLARAELAEARKCRLLGAFEGRACAQIMRLLEETNAAGITEHAQQYRQPECQAAASWGAGRVTLLGDAAHLALPFLSLGTTEAFKDAVALARAVAVHGPVPAALRAYEALRAAEVAPRHATSVALYLEFAARAAGMGEKEAAAMLELHRGTVPLPPLPVGASVLRSTTPPACRPPRA